MPDKVYVISRLGHPLMPCSPAKARHLLDDKKAKVVKRMPFTIRLLYGSTKYIQPIILGVDAGSKTIGLSASTAKEEVFAAEVMPRNDVVENLSTRREFHRARRNRTTRYRKPRSDNRVRSNHERWLAPSVKVKIQEHITSIKRVCTILPISKVVIETAEFDLQLLKAIQEGKPIPEGEDYRRAKCTVLIMFVSTSSGEIITPASAVESGVRRRIPLGCMSTILRAANTAGMLQTIMEPFVTIAIRSSISASSRT